MYVCICNPFTDSDVTDYLDTLPGAARMNDVYKNCSGEDGMNCGRCACSLKKMVDDHNSKIAVGKLSADIGHLVHKTKEEA